jgi:hypothetical protein
MAVEKGRTGGPTGANLLRERIRESLLMNHQHVENDLVQARLHLIGGAEDLAPEEVNGVQGPFLKRTVNQSASAARNK